MDSANERTRVTSVPVRGASESDCVARMVVGFLVALSIEQI